MSYTDRVRDWSDAGEPSDNVVENMFQTALYKDSKHEARKDAERAARLQEEEEEAERWFMEEYAPYLDALIANDTVEVTDDNYHERMSHWDDKLEVLMNSGFNFYRLTPEEVVFCLRDDLRAFLPVGCIPESVGYHGLTADDL